jgi:hypothetical protein
MKCILTILAHFYAGGCKQIKLNSDHTKECMYHFCVCGCSYRMNLMPENDMVMVTETIVLCNHDHSVDMKIVGLDLIATLARQNLFMPNYGALKVSILKGCLKFIAALFLL